MNLRKLTLMLLAIIIVGSFWGCTKVYTSTGVSRSEVWPSKKSIMTGRIINQSSWWIKIYITGLGYFELNPTEVSVKFDQYPGIHYYEVICFKDLGHYGTDHLKGELRFLVDGTKKNAILKNAILVNGELVNGEVVDFTFEIDDNDIRRLKHRQRY